MKFFKLEIKSRICVQSVTDDDTLNEDSDGGSHEKVERHGQVLPKFLLFSLVMTIFCGVN